MTKVLFKDKVNRLSRSLLSFVPTPGVWRDHELQRDIAKSRSSRLETNA